jgi:hypothetical protein
VRRSRGSTGVGRGSLAQAEGPARRFGASEEEARSVTLSAGMEHERPGAIWGPCPSATRARPNRLLKGLVTRVTFKGSALQGGSHG